MLQLRPLRQLEDRPDRQLHRVDLVPVFIQRHPAARDSSDGQIQVYASILVIQQGLASVLHHAAAEQDRIPAADLHAGQIPAQFAVRARVRILRHGIGAVGLIPVLKFHRLACMHGKARGLAPELAGIDGRVPLLRGRQDRVLIQKPHPRRRHRIEH